MELLTAGVGTHSALTFGVGFAQENAKNVSMVYVLDFLGVSRYSMELAFLIASSRQRHGAN